MVTRRGANNPHINSQRTKGAIGEQPRSPSVFVIYRTDGPAASP